MPERSGQCQLAFKRRIPIALWAGALNLLLIVLLIFTAARVEAQISRAPIKAAGAEASIQTGSSPRITAVSPNGSKLGARPFILSVVGRNFSSLSAIQWNGVGLATAFVSDELLTAVVTASDVLRAGDSLITVLNTDSGLTSNALTFSLPCAIPAPSLASSQTKARVGAYYFDGWSSPLTNFHFEGLPLGPYSGRQPFSSWQDAYPCAVEQQLATAHNFGVDFFIFDWYFDTQKNEPGDKLNSALDITHTLANRHGMEYAILYVDSPPFVATAEQWPSVIDQWVAYMSDPAYLRINGLPAFFIIDVGEMYEVFGSNQAVSDALAELRGAAQAAGLPGVYIVGGFGQPDGTLGQNSLTGAFEIAGNDGYDAVAFYNYPFAPPPVNGMLPFSKLADAGKWTWYEAAHFDPVAFIPTAMAGWDPRPWDEREPISNDLMWYARTPTDVADLLQAAIHWVDANPDKRPEPAPAPPLVIVEAWNEFGEGSHLIPTSQDGTSYGDAVAAMLLK